MEVREESEKKNEIIETKNVNIDQEVNDASESKKNDSFCVPKLPIKLPIKETTQQQHQQTTKCDYNTPEWSATPNEGDNFYLEVIKNGTIVEKINLNKPYFIFGRNAGCDLVLEHPSLSRFHAVLQYSDGKFDSNKHPKGYWLYDLSSTHGTFLNKKRVNPMEYVRLQSGFCFKFGGSTRLFILHDETSEQLPNDHDLNINLTHEQMRKIKENYSKIALKLKVRKEIEEKEKHQDDQDEDEIDWNIDDPNTDLNADSNELENIIKTSQALNVDKDESYYLSDPRKVLKQYFDREGEELHYDVEELGPGRFKCVIRLPIDNNYGEPMYAQVEFDGKKKDTMAQCALEACRILDSVGCLRQSAEELRHEKKKRDWQANDYYDSDEDTYLDRTGDIEKKRQKRMESSGSSSGAATDQKSGVHTFDSLKSDFVRLNKELIEINEKLDSCKKLMKAVADDDIDAYISTLKSNSNQLDTVTRTKLKRRIIDINNELIKIDKLLVIAKPTSFDLGVWKNDTINELKMKNKSENETKLEVKKLIETTSDDSSTSSNKIETLVQPEKTIKNNQERIDNNMELKKETSRQTVVVSKKEANVTIKKSNEEESDDKSVKEVVKQSNKEHKKQQIEYEYPSNDPDYNFWMPPVDQFGDGKTKLNEKYGY